MEFEEIGANNLDLGVAINDAIGGLQDKTPSECNRRRSIVGFYSIINR